MKISNIIRESQGIALILSISLLLIAFSCKNSNESTRSTYVKIKGFHRGDSTIVSEHFWKMDTEHLNDSTFSVYYLSIDTSDYSVFNENGSEITVDSSGSIDTSRVGYVLSTTFLTKESQNLEDNLYYFCGERSYTTDDKSIILKSFCRIGDNVGIVYYSDKFGFIAHYAYEWDSIILLSSLGSKEANEEYQRFLEVLFEDDSYFPVPDHMRDLL